MNTQILSNCCQASVYTAHGCDSDFGHAGGVCGCNKNSVVTMWYECSQCRQPCDIMPIQKKNVVSDLTLAIMCILLAAITIAGVLVVLSVFQYYLLILMKHI